MSLLEDILRKHAEKKNDIISECYWRKKYNSLLNEYQVLKEVMSTDVYNKVIQLITEPLEIKRYKKTIERLQHRCSFLLEERDKLYVKVKNYEKGDVIKNGSKKGRASK